MSSLSLLYKYKDKNGTDTTTRKTFLVPLNEIYVEPGFNVREIDQAHVEEFRDAFIAGEFVPPLAVQVTDKGVKIIDGHHRYYGARLATEAGHEVARLECKDFIGSDADRIAFMVTSSQGKPLTALERAAAYQRLSNQGWEVAEIARKVKRSVADVDHHLQLLACGDGLIEMVRTGEVSPTTAVALQREHGPEASTFAAEKMTEVKAAGKKKLTRNAAMPKFSTAKAMAFIQTIADADAEVLIPQPAEEILAEYREFMKKAGWEES
ncbi:ParB/RepB/Spo0J family partition protein [Dryocola sp. BD626]|uniref:ParB/RepB/Spo0J family partition protein n=1 Tax=Dryocola sp. BD626 TaxID=3133273 RepID=UPI003F4F6C23